MMGVPADSSTGSSGIQNSAYVPDLEIQNAEVEEPSPHHLFTLSSSNQQSHQNIPNPLNLNNGKPKDVETQENLDEGGNLPAVYLIQLRNFINEFSIQNQRQLKFLLILVTGILYNAFIIYAISYTISNKRNWDWCNGIGFLIILTVIVYWSFLYYYFIKRYFGRRIQNSLIKPIRAKIQSFYEFKFVKAGIGIGAIVVLVIFLVLDTWDQPRRLISALGVVILVAIGFLLSKYPTRVKWNQVFWAIGTQFVMGLLVLRWDTGRLILNCLSTKATTFLDFATAGSDFVYGYLSSGKPNDDLTFAPIFAFKPLSVMFFFGFCISILYHYGAMQWFIEKLGWLLQVTIGTTAAESMNASANIFLGMIESPLMIKPFLGRMTNCEINTIMTSGFSTVAGAALAAYITFGVTPSYVITATVMASFCALGYSKLIYPETRASHTTLNDISIIQTKSEGTAIDSAAQGAVQAVMLVGCVVANVIAFVSFVTFLNSIISWIGSLVGFNSLSFEWILSKFFIPVSWIMGIDVEECESVGLLLGLKTVANEFIAYQRMVKMKLSPRSRAIASFALCSFANVGSIGISLGGLTSLAPERRSDFGKIVGRAFLGGTIVGFINGCMAGLLLNEPGYAEWSHLITNISTIL